MSTVESNMLRKRVQKELWGVERCQFGAGLVLYGVVAGRGGTGHPGAGGGFRCPLHIGEDKGWGDVSI